MINKNNLKILFVVSIITTVPEVVRSAERMTRCKENDCGQEIDATTLICGNGHSNAQGLACSHGRNGICIDCCNNDVKKCVYGHWILVSDTRCSTCGSIFRSQLVNRMASNDSCLDSGRASFSTEATVPMMNAMSSMDYAMWTPKNSFIQPPTFPNSKEQYI